MDKRLAQAKRIAAEVRWGNASEAALSPFADLLSDPDFRTFLERLQPRLVRYLHLAQGSPEPSEPREPQGENRLLYLYPLPGERQMRAAYEVAIEGFLEYLEEKGYPVVDRGAGWVRVYLSPKAPTLNLKTTWKAYIERAFSFESLSQRLLPLLNSVRLADRGISAPKVPAVTPEVRDFLAAWYVANLLWVRERLKRRAQEIKSAAKAKQEKGLKEKQERELCKYTQALERKAKELGELKNPARSRRGTQGPTLADWALEVLQRGAKDFRDFWSYMDPAGPKAPQAMRRLGVYLSWFGPLSRQQLNTATGDKFAKIVEELLRLLSLKDPKAEVSPLVGENPFVLPSRQPGDRAETCYGCGGALDGGRLKASKLVFTSPSQRLQSGTGQEEPWVCPTCAALALLSPIKPGEGSVLVRVGDYEAPEAAKHFARLLTAGTLHVAAGRYLQLNSPKVGGKPLAQALGRLVYALQALGQEVNPGVLERFPLYLLEGAQEIPLSKRALWLSHVLQRAFASRPDEGGEVNRELGEALRYALADLPWHALYTLARRYGRVADRFALEEGLREYARFLQQETEVAVKGNADLSQRFRDVAGFTGLLYAWVGFVEAQVGRGSREAKRAVVKLLDNLQSPGEFLYVAAYELDSPQARLYEGGGSFFYQEAKRLLQEAGAEVREKEDDSGRYFPVDQDDLHRVYAHLAERYRDKRWEGFVYEVRLSLASRFPQYIRMEKEG